MTAASASAGTGLPAGLGPPLKVALARAVARMPRAGALPGSLSYEPKWDGYRCVAIHDDTGLTLWSRQGKQLSGYFPELTAARPGAWSTAKPSSGPGAGWISPHCSNAWALALRPFPDWFG